ncbi:MAG: DUF402 domain-containing protein [Candidatus Limnocylindria bacterium]
MSKTAVIVERKRRLDGSLDEFACEALAVEPGRRAVLRYVVEREHPIGPGGLLLLRPGNVTIAHYWNDRAFNVYHWFDGRTTVGFYCNVATETVIADDRVEYLDLVVDVLLRPSGAIDVLDEDELPADLSSAHRGTIAKALEELVTNPRRLIAEIERESRPYLPDQRM